jgi:hypothetical protein
MAAHNGRRRQSRRQTREPYGSPVSKPKPAKPKVVVHTFRTGTALWRLEYDDRGRLRHIDRHE